MSAASRLAGTLVSLALAVAWVGRPAFAGSIAVFDAATGAAINAALITGVQATGAVAVLGDDLLFAQASGDISELALYTSPPTIVPFISGVGPVDAIVVAPDGTITDLSPLAVAQFNASGMPIASASLPNSSTVATCPSADSTSNSGLRAFCLTMLGTVNTPNVIGEYSTSGATINADFLTISGSLGPVTSLAVIENSLYVATAGLSPGTGTVGEYDATTGAAVNASLITGLGASTQVTVANGQLYTLSGNTLEDSTLSGSPITVEPLSLPQAAAGFAVSGDEVFVVLPEPASWLLLAMASPSLLARRCRSRLRAG